ncbi:unnamed protein product [Paramecium sonneborni]|uniref:Uncharacterized protein n=1 Tax=Paramecium sonneborni TaxID=65129 RepID=A0A8S1RQE2_9CILI|nr:unnamed protein product [Paramecium sonneborni]
MYRLFNNQSLFKFLNQLIYHKSIILLTNNQQQQNMFNILLLILLISLFKLITHRVQDQDNHCTLFQLLFLQLQPRLKLNLQFFTKLLTLEKALQLFKVQLISYLIDINQTHNSYLLTKDDLDNKINKNQQIQLINLYQIILKFSHLLKFQKLVNIQILFQIYVYIIQFYSKYKIFNSWQNQSYAQMEIVYIIGSKILQVSEFCFLDLKMFFDPQKFFRFNKKLLYQMQREFY